MSFKDDLAVKGDWPDAWKDNYIQKEENNMCKIKFKTLTGAESKYYYLSLTNSVQKALEACVDYGGYPEDEIRLIKDGVQMDKAEMLSTYQCEWGGIYTLHVVLRLRGGVDVGVDQNLRAVTAGGKRMKRKTRRKSRRRKSRRRKSRRKRKTRKSHGYSQ